MHRLGPVVRPGKHFQIVLDLHLPYLIDLSVFQLLGTIGPDQRRTFQIETIRLLVILVISDFITAVILPFDLRSRGEQQADDRIGVALDLQFGQVHVLELGLGILLRGLGQQQGQPNARIGRLHGDGILRHRHIVDIHTRLQGQ